jgi:hypothetical protein
MVVLLFAVAHISGGQGAAASSAAATSADIMFSHDEIYTFFGNGNEIDEEISSILEGARCEQQQPQCQSWALSKHPIYGRAHPKLKCRAAPNSMEGVGSGGRAGHIPMCNNAQDTQWQQCPRLSVAACAVQDARRASGRRRYSGARGKAYDPIPGEDFEGPAHESDSPTSRRQPAGGTRGTGGPQCQPNCEINCKASGQCHLRSALRSACHF